MAPKTNSNKWSDIQLAIAAISMTTVIAFWNVFAGPDKANADVKAAAEQQQALLVPTVTPTTIVEPPTPEVTMPPVGYTILYGGKAPQPRVIVVRKNNGGGGGGGGNSENSGGGGGGGAPAQANQPVTSTKSS